MPQRSALNGETVPLFAVCEHPAIQARTQSARACRAEMVDRDGITSTEKSTADKQARSNKPEANAGKKSRGGGRNVACNRAPTQSDGRTPESLAGECMQKFNFLRNSARTHKTQSVSMSNREGGIVQEEGGIHRYRMTRVYERNHGCRDGGCVRPQSVADTGRGT